MEDFVQKVLPNILTAILCIILILRYKKLGPGLGYFLAAMIISTVVNGAAFFYSLQQKGASTAFLFVSGILIAVYLCFFLYFRSLAKEKIYRNLHNIVLALAVLTYIFSAVFIENFFTIFPSQTFFAISLLLLLSITIFIIETFNSDIILNITNYFPIWAMTGILVVFIGIVPLMLITNVADSIMNITTFRVMIAAINYVGYGILMFGTLYVKKV